MHHKTEQVRLFHSMSDNISAHWKQQKY